VPDIQSLRSLARFVRYVARRLKGARPMTDPIWHFNTVHYNDSASTAQRWRWRAVWSDTRAAHSEGVFHTLTDCVRDAQCNGFRGDVDPADGSFSFGGYQINVHQR
jgi:hypothetical protein